MVLIWLCYSQFRRISKKQNPKTFFLEVRVKALFSFIIFDISIFWLSLVYCVTIVQIKSKLSLASIFSDNDLTGSSEILNSSEIQL